MLLAALMLSGGCREPPLNTPPPDLVGDVSWPHQPAIKARFNAGEAMGWGVRWRGMRVGRLELSVIRDATGLVVESRLRPNRFASRFGHLRVDLMTAFDARGRPRAAREAAELGARSKTVDVAFDGSSATWQRGQRHGEHRGGKLPLHSVLSALGVVRAAAMQQLPARLLVVRGPDLYEVRFAIPSHELLEDKRAVRIDAEVRDRAGAGSLDAEISLWLSDDDKRSPLRVDVATPNARVVAELSYHSLPGVASK